MYALMMIGDNVTVIDRFVARMIVVGSSGGDKGKSTRETKVTAGSDSLYRWRRRSVVRAINIEIGSDNNVKKN